MPLMPPMALISSIAMMVALFSNSSMMAVVPVSENRTPTLISPAAAARSLFLTQICGKPAPAPAPIVAAPFKSERRVITMFLSLAESKKPSRRSLPRAWGGFVAECNDGSDAAKIPQWGSGMLLISK